MTKRINLISGPRNISTALMYSFDNRKDTSVVDEPMYAYYLKKSGVVHPGREEVLKEQPTILDEVLDKYFFCEVSNDIYFIKGMAHHYYGIDDLTFLDRLNNIFLIRNPRQLLTSFAKVISNPTMQDIGLKREWELYNYISQRNNEPVIIDSGELLKAPENVLKQICKSLNIQFTNEMLSWDPGRRDCDGIWARYWYQSVWKSTGFKKQNSSENIFPKRLDHLLEEAQHYYDLLFENSIKAD